MANLMSPALTLRKPLTCERVRVNWEHPLNRGLVAWWLMNEDGPVIYSFGKYPGILTNSPTWSATKNGHGLLFTAASTTSIEFGDPKLASLLGKRFTICVSQHPTNESAYPAIMSYTGGSPNNFFILSWDWAQINFAVRDIDWNTLVASYSVPARGCYHHLCGVRNNTIASIYVDGNKGTDGENVSIGDPVPNTMSFGAGLSGHVFYVELWNRCLSQAEIVEDVIHPYGTPSNPRLLDAYS